MSEREIDLRKKFLQRFFPEVEEGELENMALNPPQDTEKEKIKARQALERANAQAEESRKRLRECQERLANLQPQETAQLPLDQQSQPDPFTQQWQKSRERLFSALREGDDQKPRRANNRLPGFLYRQTGPRPDTLGVLRGLKQNTEPKTEETGGPTIPPFLQKRK